MNIRVITIACAVLIAMISPVYAATGAKPVSDIGVLVGDGNFAAVSEDGSKVAYVDNQNRIWTINRDGSGRRLLTTGFIDAYPAWSPDGQMIAFSRGTVIGSSSYRDIWVIKADGSGAKALTDAKATSGYYDHADWSPDGGMIAMEAAVNGMMSEVYVMELSTGKVVNATRLNTGQINRFNHQFPVWLADGERITVHRNNEVVVVNMLPVLAKLNSITNQPRNAVYVTATTNH